jgi:hypothetical protein
MKAKLNFRSVVFQRAYIIVKKTGCSFSEALTQAWERYRTFKAKTVTEIKEQIAGFDTYYQMSDDGSVYRYWSAIQKEIRMQLSTLPSSFINAIAGQLSNSNKIHLFI